MSREETKQIIGVMMAAYTNFKPQDLKMTVDTWHMMLYEYEYKLVALALKAHIATDTFPPSIGQIIQKMQSIMQTDDEMTEMEAWGYVRKAISRSLYGCSEEFEKLPVECKKAIGNANQLKDWAMMDENTVDSVIQSNFMRSYKAVITRNKELKSLPLSIRSVIEKTSENLKLQG